MRHSRQSTLGGTHDTLPLYARALRTLVLCFVVVAPALTPMQASADEPRPSADDRRAVAGNYAPLSALGDAGVTAMATSGVITAGSCKYQQAIDDPHPSSNPPGYASLHGYWLKYSGTCPTYANVDASLQALFCDPLGCYWRTQDGNSGDVKQGGGSGNRVNARHLCADNRLVGYRGVVDVDLKGVSDPSGVTYSFRDVACYPA